MPASTDKPFAWKPFPTVQTSPGSRRLGRMKKGPATKSKAEVAATTSSSGVENVDGESGVRGAPGAKPATAYSPPCTRSQERRFEKQIQDHRQLPTSKRTVAVPKHRAQLKGLENLPAPKDPSAGDALKSKEPGKTAKPPAKDKAGDSPEDPEPKTTPNVKDLTKPQEPGKSAKPPAKGRTAGAAPQGKIAAPAAEGLTKSNRRVKKAEAP